MFLGSYHFDGELDVLVPAYQRLLAGYPPDSIELHVCVRRDGGLSVFDACPTADVFHEFSRSVEFRAAIEAAGLPVPRVEALGEVQAAFLRAPIQA